MNFLCLKKAEIGGFKNNVYWSSTEVDIDNTSGRSVDFGKNMQYGSLKSGVTYDRAVRSL